MNKNYVPDRYNTESVNSTASVIELADCVNETKTKEIIPYTRNTIKPAKTEVRVNHDFLSRSEVAAIKVGAEITESVSDSENKQIVIVRTKKILKDVE